MDAGAEEGGPRALIANAVLRSGASGPRRPWCHGSRRSCAGSRSRNHPDPAFQACAYLLERGFERELAYERFDAWSTLAQANGYLGNPYGGAFACYALEHLPDRALRLVRQVLRDWGA